MDGKNKGKNGNLAKGYRYHLQMSEVLKVKEG